VKTLRLYTTKERPKEKVNAITELLRLFGMKEIVRTGKVAMARSPKTGK